MSQFDREPDPDFAVRHEAAEELKRLVRHPLQEAHRLEEEALDGSAGTTPAIVVAGVSLGVAVVGALMLALIAVAVWLAVG